MEILNRFDMVQLLTVRGIDFVSGPAGRPATTHGNWSVVGISGGKVILAKDETIIMAPVKNVRRIAKYKFCDFRRRCDD